MGVVASSLRKEKRESSRCIALEGTSNFRSFGGYKTVDGKTLRGDRVYRSDHLANVACRPDSVTQLRDKLNVRHTCDLRSRGEMTTLPYAMEGVVRHEVPIEPGNVFNVMKGSTALTEPVAEAAMLELYEELICGNKEQYSQFFRILIDEVIPSKSAYVFHCTAGKDRTGVAAALLLLLLGVPADTVFEDYMLTNVFFKPPVEKYAALRIDKDAINALLYVRPIYLQKAIDTIHERYTSVENYVTQELRISAQDLKLIKKYMLV